MKNPEQLIADYLDDALSESDQSDLNAWLKADAANMQRFAEEVMFEQQIRAAAHAKAQQQAALGFDPKTTPAKSRWLSWRPLTAAAAGIMFGMLCTSVVFAYTVPRLGLDRVRVLPFFDDSFETANAAPRRGFPKKTGVWSGDIDAAVAEEKGILPAEGQRMLRLSPREDRRFSAAARIFDTTELPLLSANGSTAVEISASFHGLSTGWLDQNQIRVAAFAEAPHEVRDIWNTDARLEKALLHTARTVTMTSCDHGWQTLRVEMEIPAGTRSLVIYLGTAMADVKATKTAHYVDDVQVSTITKEAPLP